ncbi:hypothetical protein BJX96DRAFT_143175 [Aspergillus floccosus]
MLNKRSQHYTLREMDAYLTYVPPGNHLPGPQPVLCHHASCRLCCPATMNIARVARYRQTSSVQKIHMGPAVPLFRATEDGSEEPIDEADLYRYHRYRWLSGEGEKLAKRHRNSDMDALLAAARQVTGDDRRGTMTIIEHVHVSADLGSGVKLVRCVEGQYNKAFVLSMDTSEQLVAKLPNPNAGPAFFTTASEVATRHFLRYILGVPIPRVHAWSCKKHRTQ